MNKLYSKMLCELLKKNLLNPIDAMEYAIRIENKGNIFNPFMVEIVKTRVTQLYMERIGKNIPLTS